MDGEQKESMKERAERQGRAEAEGRFVVNREKAWEIYKKGSRVEGGIRIPGENEGRILGLFRKGVFSNINLARESGLDGAEIAVLRVLHAPLVKEAAGRQGYSSLSDQEAERIKNLRAEARGVLLNFLSSPGIEGSLAVKVPGWARSEYFKPEEAVNRWYEIGNAEESTGTEEVKDETGEPISGIWGEEAEPAPAGAGMVIYGNEPDFGGGIPSREGPPDLGGGRGGGGGEPPADKEGREEEPGTILRGEVVDESHCRGVVSGFLEVGDECMHCRNRVTADELAKDVNLADGKKVFGRARLEKYAASVRIGGLAGRVNLLATATLTDERRMEELRELILNGIRSGDIGDDPLSVDFTSTVNRLINDLEKKMASRGTTEGPKKETKERTSSLEEVKDNYIRFLLNLQRDNDDMISEGVINAWVNNPDNIPRETRDRFLREVAPISGLVLARLAKSNITREVICPYYADKVEGKVSRWLETYGRFRGLDVAKILGGLDSDSQARVDAMFDLLVDQGRTKAGEMGSYYFRREKVLFEQENTVLESIAERNGASLYEAHVAYLLYERVEHVFNPAHFTSRLRDLSSWVDGVRRATTAWPEKFGSNGWFELNPGYNLLPVKLLSSRIDPWLTGILDADFRVKGSVVEAFQTGNMNEFGATNLDVGSAKGVYLELMKIGPSTEVGEMRTDRLWNIKEPLMRLIESGNLTEEEAAGVAFQAVRVFFWELARRRGGERLEKGVLLRARLPHELAGMMIDLSTRKGLGNTSLFEWKKEGEAGREEGRTRANSLLGVIKREISIYMREWGTGWEPADRRPHMLADRKNEERWYWTGWLGRLEKSMPGHVIERSEEERWQRSRLHKPGIFG